MAQGITIADPNLPDCPLMYVSRVPTVLSGLSHDMLVGNAIIRATLLSDVSHSRRSTAHRVRGVALSPQVNEAFCRMTGYEREEIVGRNCRFLQGPDTDPAAVARIRQAMKEARRCVPVAFIHFSEKADCKQP